MMTEPRDCTLIEALNAFADHLQTKPKAAQVGTIASFWNSFEGWLKFEFAFLMVAKYGRDAWIGGPPWRYGTVGVEYRYKRDVIEEREGWNQKLIDVWFSPSATKNLPTYYVELKVVFCNANKSKQFESWRTDFSALSSLFGGQGRLAKDVRGFASVLVAVGFADDEWGSAFNHSPGIARLWRPPRGDTLGQTPAGDRVRTSGLIGGNAE